MALSLTHSRECPIANARYSVPVSYRDTSGALTNPTSTDSEISVDGGASFTDCAEEVSPTGGHGYLTLSGAEMNNAALIVQCKGTGVLTEVFSIAPAFLPTLATGTATAGGAATITLQVGSSAVDDYYNGCYIRTTGGTGGGGSGGANNQARRIVDYVGSTRVATVAVAWETQPSSDTTYDILVPDGWEQAQSVRTLLALPAVAAASNGGLPTVDANNHVNGVADTLSVNLAQILGTAPTEGAAGRLAAAFTKLFDVATPLLVASEAMRGTDGAELSGAAAAAVGTLNDLSAQEVRDALKLAPTAGDPAAGSVDAHLDAVDAVADAIQAKTANLPAEPAAVGSRMDLVDAPNSVALGAVADAVLDEEVQSAPAAGTSLRAAAKAAWAQGFGRWVLSGTTLTLYGPDGSTPVRAFTLNDAENPTARTPA